jgi:hypothetical protein
VRAGVAAGAVALALAAGCGDGGGPPSAAQRERAERAGFSADVVYVAKLEGWTPAAGGSGVYGADGFQVIYGSRTGDLRLTTEARGLDAASCAALPVPAAEPPGSPVRCAADGPGWRRTSGDRQEYAQVKDGVLVRASRRADGPDYALLRKAVSAAHRADADELDAVLPADPGPPVQRGDVTGDNAPYNPTSGPGG